MVFGYGSPSRIPQVKNRKESTGYGNMVGESAKPLLTQFLLLQLLIKRQCA